MSLDRVRGVLTIEPGLCTPHTKPIDEATNIYMYVSYTFQSPFSMKHHRQREQDEPGPRSGRAHHRARSVHATHEADRRSHELPDARAHRLHEDARRHANQKAQQTSEAKAHHLHLDAQGHADQRARETPEATAHRLEEMAKRDGDRRAHAKRQKKEEPLEVRVTRPELNSSQQLTSCCLLQEDPLKPFDAGTPMQVDQPAVPGSNDPLADELLDFLCIKDSSALPGPPVGTSARETEDYFFDRAIDHAAKFRQVMCREMPTHVCAVCTCYCKPTDVRWRRWLELPSRDLLCLNHISATRDQNLLPASGHTTKVVGGLRYALLDVTEAFDRGLLPHASRRAMVQHPSSSCINQPCTPRDMVGLTDCFADETSSTPTTLRTWHQLQGDNLIKVCDTCYSHLHHKQIPAASLMRIDTGFPPNHLPPPTDIEIMIFARLRAYRKIVICHPTGTGKRYCLASSTKGALGVLLMPPSCPRPCSTCGASMPPPIAAISP
jgi:hypothetical protein